MINEVKGELKNSHAPIMKIRIREHTGMPMYRAEFRTDDKKAVIQHLNLLKNKFGISCFEIKENIIELKEVEEEKKYLDEWREKTKGLRDDDLEFQKKMKEAFSK